MTISPQHVSVSWNILEYFGNESVMTITIIRYIDDGGDDDESDDRVVEMKYSCGQYRDTLVDEVKGGLVKNDTWGRLMP